MRTDELLGDTRKLRVLSEGPGRGGNDMFGG